MFGPPGDVAQQLPARVGAHPGAVLALRQRLQLRLDPPSQALQPLRPGWQNSVFDQRGAQKGGGVASPVLELVERLVADLEAAGDHRAQDFGRGARPKPQKRAARLG